MKNNNCPDAIVEHYNYGDPYNKNYKIARITKTTIVLIYNERATGYWDRLNGYPSPCDKWNSKKISNLKDINDFANENGGTWNSGWKPVKN